MRNRQRILRNIRVIAKPSTAPCPTILRRTFHSQHHCDCFRTGHGSLLFVIIQTDIRKTTGVTEISDAGRSSSHRCQRKNLVSPKIRYRAYCCISFTACSKPAFSSAYTFLRRRCSVFFTVCSCRISLFTFGLFLSYLSFRLRTASPVSAIR